MMSRARLVVTRSGYTTLMELAELRRRARLVPTVGQSEQEYLAQRVGDPARTAAHLPAPAAAAGRSDGRAAAASIPWNPAQSL
jgi:hypothetical protein